MFSNFFATFFVIRYNVLNTSTVYVIQTSKDSSDIKLFYFNHGTVLQIWYGWYPRGIFSQEICLLRNAFYFFFTFFSFLSFFFSFLNSWIQNYSALHKIKQNISAQSSFHNLWKTRHWFRECSLDHILSIMTQVTLSYEKLRNQTLLLSASRHFRWTIPISNG